MSAMVSIQGLDRADVLAALYNAAKPLGLGHLHYDPAPMTREQAAEFLTTHENFGYLNGRVLKVHLSPEHDDFDPWLYDRDNGHGAAAAAIENLRLRSSR